jgi:hypothetical protein
MRAVELVKQDAQRLFATQQPSMLEHERGRILTRLISPAAEAADERKNSAQQETSKVGAAPVWRKGVRKGVKESPSSGQCSFHSDWREGDRHRTPFAKDTKSNHSINFSLDKQSAAGRLDVGL